MKKGIRIMFIFAVTSLGYFAYTVASWAGQASTLISPASWWGYYQPEIPGD